VVSLHRELDDSALLCLVTLACNQLGSLGSGTVCDDTREVANEACM
jgi:hypothetical protein